MGLIENPYAIVLFVDGTALARAWSKSRVGRAARGLCRSLIMMLALGAASSVWDALPSLSSSSKASSVQTASSGQTATNPFDIDGGPGAPAAGAFGTGAGGGLQISPQTMSALIAA